MRGLRVEIVLPNHQRYDLTQGVELSDQPNLRNKLELKTGELLARVQLFPTLDGFEVEKYPPDGRKIRFSPNQVAFEPLGSAGTWNDLFSLRRESPVGIVFADKTEVQVYHVDV